MTTIQTISRQAAADPKLGEFILAAAAALKSPDPAASFDWLASTAEDDDMRFAFTHAAELVRAREGR